jgi:UDP-N-acetylmuramate dehydrogenase
MPTARLQTLLQEWGLAPEFHAPVARHLTIGIGGTAELLVQVETRSQLARLWQTLRQQGIPAVLVGGGSNVAFADGLVRAGVVLNRGGELELPEAGLLAADSGVRLPDLFAACLRHGLGGLEFMAGIPGTVGGAAAVNAGAFGRAIAERLEKADIIDEQGQPQTVGPDYFAFTYRGSRLKFGYQAILRVFLRLEPREREAIKAELRRAVVHRLRHHPELRRTPSAGCFFQNPVQHGTKVPAGRLIEECGLKGVRCGDAEVSSAHANFLVNRGHSTFADLESLAGTVTGLVRQRTGIGLEREVIFVARDGNKY